MLTRQDLEALYPRLEKPLYNVVYRWVWDPEEARELVQEAFMRLWRMRARVRMETVGPLLFRIGVNLAANRRRGRRLRRMVALGAEHDLASGSRSAQHGLEDAEVRDAIRRAVLALPERLRRVILLCEFSGMSYREVGAALGIPAGTVGSRRHAALERLRRSLGPMMEA